MPSSNWRHWNLAVHRDLGFLSIGLTLLYALSGIAVNHAADWNPNYRIERVAAQVQPLPPGVVAPAAIGQILNQLGETRSPDNVFQPDPENLWLYLDKRMIRVHLPSGKVEQDVATRRPFWYPLNFLHLNHPKNSWTWIADLYAGALALLALTGLLMLPQRSRQKRSLLLVAAGLLIPLLFLGIYY